LFLTRVWSTPMFRTQFHSTSLTFRLTLGLWLVFTFAYFTSHFHIYFNKILLINGFFSLFLGPWLEVKKKPKTPTYLRIFRAKRKPNSLKPILLLLGEEDKIINVVISRPVQGQTAHFDFGTTAPEWSRKRGNTGAAMPVFEATPSLCLTMLLCL